MNPMTGAESSIGQSAPSQNTSGAKAPLEDLAQLQQDLQLARELQQAMLPLQYPTFPHGVAPHESALLFHHTYHSNEAIGGDFFAIFPLSDTAAGVFLCDVMGHGVRAALVTAMIGALLEEFKTLANDPGALLTELNRDLTEILQRASTPVFTSAFYLIADAATGELCFANAGHPEPLHAHRARRSGEMLRIAHLGGTPGPALGMIPDAVHCTSEGHLSEGDLLLLYTDGLFEAQREDGELFGEERVLEAVRQRLACTPDIPLTALCDGLLDDALHFGGEFEDDMCLLGMEVARLGVTSDAARDNLTGLYNPNYLNETLDREMHRAGRHGYQIGVITLEISGLDRFAATHGQRAVDELLREFGALLNRHTRRSDIACRPRATGFTLVLPEASLNNTQHKAAQLCELLRGHHPQLFDGGALSLALGLASFPQNGATGESIVRAATEAMQNAQQG